MINENPSPNALPPSPLGMISLAIGLLTTVGYCVMLIASMAVLLSKVPDPNDQAQINALIQNPGSLEPTALAVIVAAGLCLYGSPVLAIIGLGLGAGGLLQGKNRLYPTLGMSVNGLLLLGSCLMLGMGFMNIMGAR